MASERLERIRNIQCDDWYGALVMRPLCIALMLAIADVRALTPNLITTVGNLFKLAGVVLILPDERDTTILAAIALQLGTLFDHLDGTMARYRGLSSTVGSYYDKASDVVTWLPIVMAIGWVAHARSGAGMMLVLPAVAAYALLVAGYIKWVLVAEERGLSGPDLAPPQRTPPPQRSAGDWARWVVKTLAQVYRFDEIDLFFWVGLLLVLDELPALLWLLAVTQTARMVMMLGVRGAQAARIDRARRERAAGDG